MQFWIMIEQSFSLWRVYGLDWDYTDLISLEDSVVDILNQESESLANKNNDIVADYYNALGLISHTKGVPKDAIDNYTKSLEYRSQEGKELHWASSLMNIAICYVRVDNYPKAIELYKKVEIIYDQFNNQSFLLKLYNNIGALYRRMGKLVLALEYLFKSLEISTSLEKSQSIPHIYSNIGSIYMSQGKYDEGLYYTRKSVEIGEKLNSPDIAILTKVILAQAEIQVANYKEGRSILLECLQHNQKTESPFFLSEILFQLIRLHYYQKEPNIEDYKVRLHKLSEMNDNPYIKSLHLISEAIQYKETPDFDSFNLAINNFKHLLNLENIEFDLRYYALLNYIELLISKNILFPSEMTMMELESRLKECYAIASKNESTIFELDAMLLEIKINYFENKYDHALEIAKNGINKSKEDDLTIYHDLFIAEKNLIVNKLLEMKNTYEKMNKELTMLEKEVFESYFFLVRSKSN